VAFLHVAAFFWNRDADSATLGREVATALRSYAATCEDVLGYYCGPDVGITDGAADFGVVGRFASREAYFRYRDDARHQAILSELIVPHLESRTVVQLEH